MRAESIHRQVALVSYGSLFLRSQNTLEDWYPHAVFHNARFVFRASADNALLADDFTLWLSILKGAGAVRLSLHGADEFAATVPRDERRRAYAVVVHYADGYQIWTVGAEEAAWRANPTFKEGPDYWHYFNATGHASAIDTYWGGEKLPGRFEVPATDWKALAATIGADLDIKLPSGLGPAAPFILPQFDHSTRTVLPLLPPSHAWPAHRLAAALDREQGKFANDTHPKNEGNVFQHLDDQAAAELTHWAGRLDSWMNEVLIRGANDCAGAGANSRDTPFMRHQPPPPGPHSHDAADVNAVTPPLSQAVDKASTPGKWTDRIAFAIAIAVFTLFVVAIAHVIPDFPWLAIFIALPFALHGHYRKKDRQA
ncbi:hypothetical protein ACFFTM_18120 [Pseudoduganella plicata]|uniref:DUF2207 domain-containing protein n=1 Tax=Pseudoduganella plicata TaxID=321984 RepID=A0A4P7BHI5_9BURK|nr:hypothetical protein [Pseudoduganella plicata]QBQ37742.1 hypothetical protein E1742_17360 [Pseudoduganella plicata]GGY92773.1 hypothetical protein GCM10007388_27700 [Pseudoduganella plicata]